PPNGTRRREWTAMRSRRRTPRRWRRPRPGPEPAPGRRRGWWTGGACCGTWRRLRSVLVALGFGFRVLDVVLLAGVDLRALLAVDLEDAQRALVEGAEQAVVDQHEVAGHVGLELDDGRAAGRDQRGLHVLLVLAAALEVDLVEDLADDV